MEARGIASDPLHGREIVCFSNDWGGDPLSKTHLMRLLARDNRILWVNSLGNRAPRANAHDLRRAAKKLAAAASPLREVEHNLFVLSPLALPVFGSSLVRSINRVALSFQIRRAMGSLGFGRPIVWSFLPAAEWVAKSLDPELLLYHCVDEFSAFSDAPASGVAQAERRLIEAADLVVVSAERLYESKRPLNPRTVLVRHGVDHAHFSRALDKRLTIPEEIAGLPRPIFGFFGLLADWVDLELLGEVARAYPGGSVVIIGKTRVDVSGLKVLRNVHLLGPRPYERLPAYCKAFDVALMPFRLNELTLNANPLKVREYLAAGLPVVSTAVPEAERLGLCRVARDREGFLAELHEALRRPGPHRERSEAVRGESWEARLDEIRAHVAALRRPAGPSADVA